MYIEVDLNEVRRLIEDPGFANYLLENTTDFSVAAFILQTLLDATSAAAASSEPLDPIVDIE